MVVRAGLTLIVEPLTLPIPLSIDTEVAPDTDQDSVVVWPATIPEGLGLKAEITGGSGVTVTVVVLVTLPPPLVAVKV